MSISGLSGASSIGPTALPQAAFDPTSTKPPTAAEKAQAQADARAADQKALLEQIRKKGIYAWAQEEKLAALKARIRQQVLADRKLDEDSLSKMDPAARKSAETSIQEEITRRIKEALKANLEGQARDAAAQGEPPKPLLIDISV